MKTLLKSGIYSILGGIFVLSLFINESSVYANDVSSDSHESIKKSDGLIEIDTSAIDDDTQLYIDPTKMEDIVVSFDNQSYKVEDNKLVEVANLFNIITPYALAKYTYTLDNGHYGRVDKIVQRNTIVTWGSFGPAERREMFILDPNLDTLASLTSSSAGFTITSTAKITGNHAFMIRNYSATKQTWNCELTF